MKKLIEEILYFKNQDQVTVKIKLCPPHQYTVLRARGLGQGRENLVQQQRSAEAEAFIEKYRVTGGNTYDTKTRKVKCFVMWGGVPEAAIQVRLLEQEGVQAVCDSFLEIGIKQPMEIIGVIWAEQSNPNLNKDNFIVDLTSAHPPAYIHIICGGHRTKALQLCHQLFPLKVLYKFFWLTILVVPRTNPNIRDLLYIGNSDNRKAQVLVKTSQWSVVCQFRRAWERFEADPDMSKKDKVDYFSAYKIETQPQTGFMPNTCHTFSALCSVDKPVWDLMVRIFNGEFIVNKDLKGQKKPDAVTHFTQMGGIPTYKLVAWLQRVLDGEWLTSTFSKRCIIWRKAAKVSDQTLEYICIHRPKYQFVNMNDVAKVYPAVNDPLWFDAVVKSCDDAVKAKLSPHAQKMIDDMMEEKEEADKEKKVLAYFDCLFDLTYHLFFFTLSISQKLLCMFSPLNAETLFGR